jgi:hypothetical protein
MADSVVENVSDVLANVTNATKAAAESGDSIELTYFAIVTMACACVYAGSKAALGQAGPREGQNKDEGQGWEVEKASSVRLL